jgi:dihydroceramide fatty acyl 2-hydroxylase
MKEMLKADEVGAPKGLTTRMFESDLVERFSRIHPVTPFVFWLPLFSLGLYWTIASGAVSFFEGAGLFTGGLLVWTLAEYFLHRFLFHWSNDTTWGKRIHFILHGVHHDFPHDKDRLVMPLGASIPIGGIFFLGFIVTMGLVRAVPFFGGFIIGYLAYDGTHYAVHHFTQRTAIGRFVKRHHMLHHHADHSGGFGVSSPLWDLVFRTMPQPARRRERAKAAAGERAEA